MGPLLPSDEGTVGFWVALCFTLNSIMGTGFLTLPWAFAQTGVLLGTVVLVATAVLGNVAKDLVLQAMAWAAVLHHRKNSSAEGGEELVAKVVDCVEEDEPTEVQDGLPFLREKKEAADLASVGDRPMEYAQLCDVLLGRWGRRCYALCLCVFCYGTLWAYASVFATSLSHDVPLPLPVGHGHQNYHVYLLLFALVCVPLTCTELQDQVGVQVFLSACRLVMVIVMVGTTAAAYTSTVPVFGEQAGAAGVSLCDVRGLHLFVPIAMYANVFHHAIPSLAQPVRDKASLHHVFGAAFLVCTCFYSAIGGTVAGYFGEATQPSSNLNWRHYRGAEGMPVWLVSACRHYVVLFPALDVLSAFPLNGITLGNNLLGAYQGAKVEARSALRTRFRLLAALPPLVGAAFVRDLGVITNYTGMMALSITFVFPALLHVQGRRRFKCQATTGGGEPEGTAYDSWLTGLTCTPWVIGLLGVAFTAYSLVLNLTVAMDSPSTQ